DKIAQREVVEKERQDAKNDRQQAKAERLAAEQAKDKAEEAPQRNEKLLKKITVENAALENQRQQLQVDKAASDKYRQDVNEKIKKDKDAVAVQIKNDHDTLDKYRQDIMEQEAAAKKRKEALDQTAAQLARDKDKLAQDMKEPAKLRSEATALA